MSKPIWGISLNRNYAIEFLLHNLTNENHQLTRNVTTTLRVIFIVKVNPDNTDGSVSIRQFLVEIFYPNA